MGAARYRSSLYQVFSTITCWQLLMTMKIKVSGIAIIVRTFVTSMPNLGTNVVQTKRHQSSGDKAGNTFDQDCI